METGGKMFVGHLRAFSPRIIIIKIMMMLTMAATVPQKWPGELHGTTLANQHRFLLTMEKYHYYYLANYVLIINN